jgi:type IX secretion system PorP/SprF family membrane protein
MKNKIQKSKSQPQMKRIAFTILFIAAGLMYASAQQDPMYNQYIFNAYTINPAEAGTRNYGTASFLYRWQWLGISGSPSTGSAGMETGLGKAWGLGINFVDDKIGPAVNQTINLSTAYRISLSEKWKMSLGVNVVGNLQQVKLNEIENVFDPNDPLLLNNIRSFNPNVGGGMLFYSDKNFLGISVPRFTEYKLSTQDLVSLDQVRHLFVYYGHSFRMGPHLRFKPSTLAKVVKGAPVEFDFNGVISFYDMLDLGANYRSGDGLGLLAGITIRERLVFNYAYEIPLSLVRRATIQTHEMGIRYKFGKNQYEKIESPRFFN